MTTKRRLSNHAHSFKFRQKTEENRRHIEKQNQMNKHRKNVNENEVETTAKTLVVGPESSPKMKTIM